MPFPGRSPSAPILALLILFTAPASSVSALELKTEYFDAEVHPGIDLYRLVEKLDVNSLAHLETLSSREPASAQGALKEVLDALYLEVSDILDIHVYSLRIRLEVLPDRSRLSGILQKHLGQARHDVSFYRRDNNTIYIADEDVRVGVLAHEVAHAIMNHYFVVPPPVKVQEVLASYVEHSIARRHRGASAR